MKVAILGASGRAGSEITKEAVARGHSVIAIARKPEAIPSAPGVTAVAGDASDADEIARLIAGCDAVISALVFKVKAETLVRALRQAGVGRLLVTGGAASLEVSPGVRLYDVIDIPDEYKPNLEAGMQFLKDLKEITDIDWTFFSPALWFEVGPRTGKFQLGGDQLLKDAEGESRISFADYAIAMVDELEQRRHSRSRFTIAY